MKKKGETNDSNAVSITGGEGSEPTGLVHYDTMRRQLALCSTTDEVKEIKDRARAAEIYFKQIHDTEAEWQLARIRCRAERRLGELLIEMKAKGERDRGAGGDRRSRSTASTVKTLSDLGLTKDESSTYQRLAEIPEDEFERAISDPNVIPTTRGILASHDIANIVAGAKTRIISPRRTYDISAFVKEHPKPIITIKAPEMIEPEPEPEKMSEPEPEIEEPESQPKIEAVLDEQAEKIARDIVEAAGALNELLSLSLPQRKAALESSYGPILHTELAWLEKNAQTFLAAATKKPSKQAIAKARAAHPELDEDVSA